MPGTPPPPTRREDVVEHVHGHRIADPYRWLEAPADDPAIRAFVRSQNSHTDAHLRDLPLRIVFRTRLGRLWNHPRRGAPWRRGDRWFQLHNDGLQEQDVLWSAPAVVDADRSALPPADRWSVLLDPNTWSTRGTVALSGLEVTQDGSLVAFARSEAGSDWLTWQVVDTRTGRLHADLVPWSRFSGATWLPDGSGFLYGAYDPPAPGQEHAAVTIGQRLQLHVLGTRTEDDRVVHARPDQPEWGFAADISHDGRWLLITIRRGTDPASRIHLAAIEDGVIGPVRPLLDEGDAHYEVLGVLEGELLLRTDLDAALGRIIAVELRGPQHIRELVAEEADRLQDVTLVGGATPEEPAWLVCHRLHHATSRLRVHDARDGRPLHDVGFAEPVTVAAVAGGRHDRHVYVTVTSFTAPVRVLHHDLASATTAPTTADGEADAGDEVCVEQVRVHHDGVAVPVFVVHRCDVTPDGSRPTILWGYGGFDIPVTPAYRPAWRAWVDAGGVLAVACLRGGGEYGRAWHDDGRLANKQHVFDDALACAAWLTGTRSGEVHASPLTAGAVVDRTWSAPRHLGIEGRSNGGLLVGACLTQAPAAFASAVPEVGVLDLLRFHRFTIGWAWTSDYGDPEDPHDLAVLLRYSPYHRVVDGTAYPATLLTTGDTDDRVVPAHSYKTAAALQHAQAGDAPILLRVDTTAGHGAGKPVSKLLDERADVLAFHAHHLGLLPTAVHEAWQDAPGAAPQPAREARTWGANK